MCLRGKQLLYLVIATTTVMMVITCYALVRGGVNDVAFLVNQTVKYDYRCKSQTIQLTCPRGSIIDVTRAYYGTDIACDSNIKHHCGKDVTNIIKLMCKNKAAISFLVDDATMGFNPCTGWNYLLGLQVWYNCKEPVLIETPYPNVTVGLLVHEYHKRPRISNAILSVHKNSPISWNLYIHYHHPSIYNDSLAWYKSLPFHDILQKSGRKIIYVQMDMEYVNHDFNKPCLDINFWKNFTEDYILTFQADAAMCHSKGLPYNLADFFNFDFVGAPWWQGVRHWQLSDNASETLIYVGNGGFALRNRKFAINCLERGNNKDGIITWPPEDYFFALCTQRFGRHTNRQIAAYFSVELPSNSPKEGSLGMHSNCWNGRTHISPEYIEKWISRCPEVSFTFPNNTCPENGKYPGEPN